jgi:hypothetical protein
MLLMFYLAMPPFPGAHVPENAAEGHYFIVNKNLIEMLIMLVFATTGNRALVRAGRLPARHVRAARAGCGRTATALNPGSVRRPCVHSATRAFPSEHGGGKP